MYTYPEYTEFPSPARIWCATPGRGGVIHRFFDTSPFSPSGRYLALCRLPYEDKNAGPGDCAEVLLCDTYTGEERVVALTRGWETQVGANVQWGANDDCIYYNDVAPGEWEPYLARVNIKTGEIARLGRGAFMLSPDGALALTHNMKNSRVTQYGYGVTIPDELVPLNGTHPADDGFCLTHTRTGECRMLVSLAQLIDATMDSSERDTFKDGGFYGFQCKWNRQQTRLMLVARFLSNVNAPRRNMAFTMNTDGSDIKLALPWQKWALGGHHVNWHPDGEHITMNLKLDGKTMRFVIFSADGSGLRPLLENAIGSGHPSIHCGGRYLITDSYSDESRFATPDGTVPIRLVDLKTGRETELTRIYTEYAGSPDLRIDPHPAWDRDFKRIVFNGFLGGTRRVYVIEGWEKAAAAI